MNSHIVGVDLGGTKVLVSIANKDGILDFIREPVKLKGTNTTIPEQIDAIISSLCKKHKIKKDSISAVGVASCSPFVRISGKLATVAGNLCGSVKTSSCSSQNDWSYIPLEAYLSEKYPSVIIRNDCVAAVVAERLFGAGKGVDDLLYVAWSTGIGTGAYMTGIGENGSTQSFLLQGKNGNAPHGGLMFANCNKDKSDISVDKLCSGTGIASAYGPNTTTKEVFEKYFAGDKKAKEIIDQVIIALGKCLVSLTKTLDTKLILVGGGVFLPHKEFLLPKLKEVFSSFSSSTLTKEVDIACCGLKENIDVFSGLSLVIPKEWISPWQELGCAALLDPKKRSV